MTFRLWLRWIKSKPVSKKWFIFLVLLRPLIDNFYFLKEVSPLLSPLYWVGILTPFLCMAGMMGSKRISSKVDKNFSLWSLSIFFSVVFISLNNNAPFLNYLAAVFKLVSPVFLFLFLRFFIRSKVDLEGILYTFYLSFFIVAFLISYELIFNPIKVTYRSYGVERMQGNFGDVASYGLYFSLAFLTVFYFWLKKIFTGITTISRLQTYLFILLIAVALPRINHATTTICLVVIILIFSLFLGRKKFSAVFLFVLLGGSLVLLFWNEIYSDFILPLYGSEIEIVSGEGNEDQLLHGRVGRLKMLYHMWLDYPLVDKLFGSVISNLQYWTILVSGTHNDFVRILMLGGFFGLFSYLGFLFVIFIRILKYNHELLFLGVGTLILLFLYSNTLTPTLYPNFMYLILSVFAYFSLPRYYNLHHEKLSHH